ncbi:16S rRNA (guanine(527)-N(7))-methyltransferase RsmG [Levilactobacillus bambusae]|uniref:Ribosomal RNA small subunit methyltransferase G n=1 Tax=Levilactobacillus bambusae TaxID=2024736 RepID=A0A2V1MZ36_9LACO|nr:16S rRNA (guanine(527)-N(7))-methyltransferase RsmG [Levilactobacillus bambusae]PWF99747.1 16S rRNA (guanine(527)-N(7))-methyltransferase RsmG [Levilactobacillus bambusae]
MNPEEFRRALEERGISLTDKQMQQFADYYQLLVATNEHVNLTTITDEPDVYLKHFYDSLTPAFFVTKIQTEPLSIVDVGAGAGFPSIPLKIAFPQLQVTIVDSLNKRITFLQELAAKLDLTGVAFYHDRAETFGAKKSPHREAYDIATARAVARLSVLSELCLPLVKVGGQFIALKASAAGQEIQAAEDAINTLGGQLVEDDGFSLPDSDDPRHLLVIDKVRQTPKRYPRRPGTPNKEPIGTK